MKAKLTILTSVATLALLFAAIASACGGSESDWNTQVAPAPAAMQESVESDSLSSPSAAAAERVVIKEVQVPGETVVVEKAVEAQASAPSAPAALVSPEFASADESQQPLAQLVTQQRIIVRTVNMVIVVEEIQNSIDRISDLAEDMGGWVVSTDRRQKHTGSVSIRVPAQELESVIETLRAISTDVESEVSTSQDVTDEYYDLRSRLTNQQATEAALIKLLERAESVEHALSVQRELSSVQENVERLLGRIKLLEETSAFSLIRLDLKLAPIHIDVDAGPDQSVAVFTPTRFKATFTPPDGMDQHDITWDFGDGSHPVTINRVAPTTTTGELVSATVTHHYEDPTDSPFIVQVQIDSYGDGGAAHGDDTLIVTVSETPVIEVFAGEGDYDLVQNEEAAFSGSFTRPPGLSNVRYHWDFGDGTPPIEGVLNEGITRVNASHAYADYRRTPYVVKFTISADSAVGEVSASHEIFAYVREDPGLIVGGFDVGDSARTAIQTLSIVLSWLTTALVWVGIFGIVWIPLAVVAVIIIRRRRRSRTNNLPRNPRPPAPSDEPGTQAEASQA